VRISYGRPQKKTGGLINFTMGSTPNKNRGTTASAYPYSFSTDKNKKPF